MVDEEMVIMVYTYRAIVRYIYLLSSKFKYRGVINLWDCKAKRQSRINFQGI